MPSAENSRLSSGFGSDRLTKRGESPPETRLRRAQGDTERLGHGRSGHTQVVVEHEDRTLIRPEMAEASLELIAVVDETGLVDHGRFHDRCEIDFDRPSPAPTNRVQTRVDGQSVHPRVEAVWVAQTRQVAPRPDVSVLDGVARELRIAEDQASDGLQPGDGRPEEQGEGIMVASARSLDEISLVHGHLVTRPFGRVQD